MVSEKKLRIAIRKIIKESLKESREVNESLSAKEAYQILIASLLSDEDGPVDVAAASELASGQSLASVGGPTASEPGLSAGYKAEIFGTEPEEEGATGDAAIAAAADAVEAGDELAAVPEEEEEEEVEVTMAESMLRDVLNEARRRRRRKLARLKASQAATAEASPAVIAAPKPVARKVAKKKQSTTEVKPIKEWYREELFAKLIKESVQ